MQIKKERRMNHKAAPKENEKEFLSYIISHSKRKRYRAEEIWPNGRENGAGTSPLFPS